jgi:hypothetical protein
MFIVGGRCNFIFASGIFAFGDCIVTESAGIYHRQKRIPVWILYKGLKV